VKNARLTPAQLHDRRNVGASGLHGYRATGAINAGDVEGPRMRASGPPLGITGGHCDNNLLPFRISLQIRGRGRRSLGRARARFRETIKYGADVIKICASGGVSAKAINPERRNTHWKKCKPSPTKRISSAAKLLRTRTGTQSIQRRYPRGHRFDRTFQFDR